MKNSLCLKTLIQKTLITVPGVFDGLSAKLASNAGFSALYASGGAIARSTGRPDLGLLSFTEVLERVRDIVEATSLPVIADVDTGFGNVLNVRRTVRAFEQAGVSAVHIEDQVFPKRCGHLSGKQLIDRKEMALKVQSAVECRQNSDFLIIARTDAIAVEGFEAAIERARCYADAGADVIFVEAPETLEQIEQIAQRIPQPKLINLFYGGKTPLVDTHTLREMGYRIVIIPSDLQRAAIKAMQKVLGVLQKEGNSHSISDELVSFQEREALIESAKWLVTSR